MPLRMAAGAAIVTLACLVASPPANAQAPTPAPPAEAPAHPEKPAEIFGEEVTLPPRTIVFMKGSANWDAAYSTLVDAFKSVYEYLEKQGIKPAGPPMTIYTETDDTGFDYQAAVPVEREPKEPPKGDIEVGQAPTGKALKFVYRGSYDGMDTIYEAITEHLEEKRIEMHDMFIEEYLTDPRTTPQDKLVVNIYVPTK
jgi:effector-binding domain-containing protein